MTNVKMQATNAKPPPTIPPTGTELVDVRVVCVWTIAVVLASCDDRGEYVTVAVVVTVVETETLSSGGFISASVATGTLKN